MVQVRAEGPKGQKQHALKGQKLLAQGIALGIVAVSKAPCKGKSFVIFAWGFKAFALTGRQACVHDYPGRCPGLGASALYLSLRPVTVGSGRINLSTRPWYAQTGKLANVLLKKSSLASSVLIMVYSSSSPYLNSWRLNSAPAIVFGTLTISSNYTIISLIGRFCTRVCKIFRGHIWDAF